MISVVFIACASHQSVPFFDDKVEPEPELAFSLGLSRMHMNGFVSFVGVEEHPPTTYL
jgi:hypothetical protein